MVNWKKLQNGTDIRGVAIEGVEGESVNLTPEVVESIAKAFVIWLSETKNKNIKDLVVSVGTDSRLSGPKLREAFVKGTCSMGASIMDAQMASTPAMFVTTVLDEFKADGAVMITASHLPFNRNGLKFFTEKGGLEKQDIKAILNFCEEDKFEIASEEGKVTEIELMDEYSRIFVEKIRNAVNSKEDREKPLKGFKIIVDAGNGAGGFYASKVLEELGADTEGSQFLDPDGNFPNHIPNPEDKEAMESISKAVVDNKADFGIIFDTDVDRAAAVDRFGNSINRNALIALISAIILEEHPNTYIVTDSVTSDGLKDFIEQKGGIHHRFKRGYKNVINESIRLNEEGKESHLAIETSGHAAIKENYFLDDGAYLITKLLIKMAQMKQENKDMMDLIADLKQPKESEEFRIKIKLDEFKDYGLNVIEELKQFSEAREGWNVVPNNYEGVRISCDENSGNGWFLLRMSLHDPVLPMNVESDTEGGVKEILKELKLFFERYEKLDISKIEEYL